MTLTLLVMFATAHLENLDLVVATLCYNRSLNLGTVNQWSAEANGFAFAYCQNLIESDFGTNVCRYLFYFIFFACDNFVLFAAGFYDRVHGNSINKCVKNPENSGGETGKRQIIQWLGVFVKGDDRLMFLQLFKNKAIMSISASLEGYNAAT